MEKSSTRPRAKAPAIREHIVKFHADLPNWTAGIGSDYLRPILRASRSAVIGMDLAGDHGKERQLRRSRRAITTCRTLFELAFIEKLISARTYDEARRRCEQLLAGLDRLDAVPLEEWPTTPVPPLKGTTAERHNGTADVRPEQGSDSPTAQPAQNGDGSDRWDHDDPGNRPQPAS